MKLLLYIRTNNEQIELIPLSSKYLFSLTSSEQGLNLTYVVNKQYIPNFYGPKINSFSVIVGDNGVGKTSLLKSIAKKSEEVSKSSFIPAKDSLLYEIDDQWYLTNEFSDLYNLSTLPTEITNRKTNQERKIKNRWIRTQIKNVSSYFYSPALEVNPTIEFQIVNDCSTSGILEEDKTDIMTENAYLKLVNSDMHRQIDFVINYRKEVSALLKVPDVLKCRISIMHSEYCEKLISFASFEDRIHNSFIFKNYEQLWKQVKANDFGQKNFAGDKLSNNWKIQLETFFIRNLLKIYPVEAVIHEKLSIEEKSDELRKLIAAYNRLTDFFEKHLEEDQWPKEPNEVETFVKQVSLSLDDDFLDFYFKELRTFLLYGVADMFSFSWQGLSSGENALLNLFSRFSLNTESINENVLLFIDEIDLGFHPKWQQQLIDLMLSIFPRLFQKDIQIVMSTHSPLLLSNFCQKDVILLTKDENGERHVQENDLLTLGANMHKLLANNFFLKNALMGEFAKKRINEYFNFVIDQKRDEELLVDYGENPKYLESILTEIGEPILRKKAIEEYQNYCMIKQKGKQKIEDRQKQLEMELEELRLEVKRLKGESTDGKD